MYKILFLASLLFASQFYGEDLFQLGFEAQQKAYCPYSQYSVGAALQTKSGKVITGCNIENAVYGLTSCAERVAIFKAVSEGETEFEKIIVVTKEGGMPCGACRQVLYEFNPRMQIITYDENGNKCMDIPLNEVLPHAWGPKNLN